MKELSEYTDAEKIAAFDKMYQDAYEQFICVKNMGTSHESSEHWTWETVIDLLGDDIWDEWNQYAI